MHHLVNVYYTQFTFAEYLIFFRSLGLQCSQMIGLKMSPVGFGSVLIQSLQCCDHIVSPSALTAMAIFLSMTHFRLLLLRTPSSLSLPDTLLLPSFVIGEAVLHHCLLQPPPAPSLSMACSFLTARYPLHSTQLFVTFFLFHHQDQTSHTPRLPCMLNRVSYS